MPIRIIFDPDRCSAKITGVWTKNLPELSGQVLQDCNQYVKVDQHTLESSSYAQSILEEGKLIWQTDYAKRQYWEIKTSLTPGRTWKWCETAKRKCKEAWRKFMQARYDE